MQRLVDSVARVGVLTPLHLRRPAAPAPLQLVAGSRRLGAARQTGTATVPALIHEARELSEEQGFSAGATRQPGLPRLQRGGKGARAAAPAARLPVCRRHPARNVLPAAGPAAAPQRRGQLLHPGRPGRGVAGGNGRLRAARRRGAVGRRPGYRRPAGGAAPVHHPSTRQQPRQGNASPTSTRCASGTIAPPPSCSRDSASPPWLADPQRSGPQKREAVRQALHQARYPRFTAHERRFREAAGRLRLPPGVSLRPPPYFESLRYQVSFSFSGKQELRQAAQRLLDAADAEAMDDLLRL